ncbi:MAG: cytochrome P450 [Acidimicrobiia bacterium]
MAGTTGVERASGIPASLEPVDWNPPGLPDDPDEVIAWLLDPNRRGEVYPLYRRLRELAPVHQNPPEVFGGAWTFTRHAETDTIFRNPRVVNNPAVIDQAFSHGDGSFTGVMRDVMLWNHPEPHQRVRNLVKTAFTPRAIERWRPIAERVAHDLCDRIAAKGEADLVEDYNYEIPFNVIAHILGIPEDDFPTIKQHAWDFARAGEKMVTDEVAARGDVAARAFEAYFGNLAEERASKPGDDLISTLLAAEADGDKLTRRELVVNCILLLQAGHETTQDLMGNAQVALFRHPDQLALLRAEPELTKNAVEEFLRYDASVQTNHRVVLDGMTVGDVEIPPGGLIYIFLGAVNRDPARYADPDRLDILRDVTSHLAFSFGAYYCLGAALARTEAAVGIRTLLDRFPNLRPATGGFEWRNTLLLRGPQRLEVLV